MAANKNMEWYGPAYRYLERVGLAEYKTQLAQHLKKRRSKNTFRFTPTEYMERLIQKLDVNDEEGFKAIKMLQGYSSELGV